MRKWIALVSALLALAVVGAGCGGDDEEQGGGGARTQEHENHTGGGGEAAQSSARVAMRNIAFEPADITVKKGGKVTWTNEESAEHDVTKTGGPGPRFTSGRPGGMSKGDRFTHVFTMPGKFSYVCTVHPNMKGTVTVR